jgi:hypothetical protein
MPSELNVNKISPASGTEVSLGDSGDTVTIPSGVTLAGDGSNLTGVAPTKATIEALGIELPAANLTGTIHADRYTDTVYTHPTTAGNKHIPTAGATDQILTYSSSGTAAWTTPAAGGKILQVVYDNETKTGQTTTSTSEQDVLSNISPHGTWEVAITPSSTSSKILVFASVQWGIQGPNASTQQRAKLNLHEKIGSGSWSSGRGSHGNHYGFYQADVYAFNSMSPINWLSSPNTTSEVKYKITYKVIYGGYSMTASINNDDGGNTKATNMTLMEVAG